ncbi:Uncharacterised protein [Mycobacteroides abscessus]|nr:Uncharacterised protein [Mycobacteroides abscessus]
MGPPLTIIAAELSTSSTVALAAVDLSPMVSPLRSSGAPAVWLVSGRIATKTSPRGVAERSSAVVSALS